MDRTGSDIDLDGTATVAAEQVLTRTATEMELKAPYPNPARGAATVPLSVSAQGLASGTYFLRLTAGGIRSRACQDRPSSIGMQGTCPHRH